MTTEPRAPRKSGWTVQELNDAISYHQRYIAETDIGVDWMDAHERCWRCGDKTKTQKCHIVPRSLGGEDHASNYVALCADCHDEAPNVADPAAMWLWIQATHAGCYDQFWGLRAEALAHQLEPRLREWQATSTLGQEQLLFRYRQQYERAGTHFSQKLSGAKLTLATRAWLLIEIWRPDYDYTRWVQATPLPEDSWMKDLPAPFATA